jgi:hypothetical protein
MGLGKWWMAIPLCTLLSTPVPAGAHHAVQSQFDSEKPIELTGVLTRVEWVNPHSRVYLLVTSKDGTKTEWMLETLAPNKLREKGLGRASDGGLKVGETYSILGFAARSGKPVGFLKTLKMPDGHTITVWFGDPNGDAD